jgi:hypothetical protein
MGFNSVTLLIVINPKDSMTFNDFFVSVSLHALLVCYAMAYVFVCGSIYDLILSYVMSAKYAKLMLSLLNELIGRNVIIRRR